MNENVSVKRRKKKPTAAATATSRICFSLANGPDHARVTNRRSRCVHRERRGELDMRSSPRRRRGRRRRRPGRVAQPPPRAARRRRAPGPGTGRIKKGSKITAKKKKSSNSNSQDASTNTSTNFHQTKNTRSEHPKRDAGEAIEDGLTGGQREAAARRSRLRRR